MINQIQIGQIWQSKNSENLTAEILMIDGFEVAVKTTRKLKAGLGQTKDLETGADLDLDALFEEDYKSIKMESLLLNWRLKNDTEKAN